MKKFLIIFFILVSTTVMAGINEDLISAVKKNDIAQVERILLNGADINTKINGGFSPLMIASRNTNLELVRFLLKKGANVNARDNNKNTALIHAVSRGHNYKREEAKLIEENHLKIIKLLLDKGADVNAKGYNNSTPLLRASERNFPGVIELLIDRGADVKARTEQGSNVLYHSAQLGKIDMLKLLLDKGADVNTIDNTGRSVLWWASMSKKIESVKLLISKGADVNIKLNGYTLLWHLLNSPDNNHEEIINVLKESGATIGTNINDNLLIAAIKGDKEQVENLVRIGADVNANMELNGGDTVLMQASANGSVEIVKFLLNKGAKIDNVNSDGVTALMIASRDNHVGVVKLLLDRGAKVNIKSKHGLTALNITESMEINKLLKKAGAK